MAWYKYGELLAQRTDVDWFDTVWHPGSAAPYSGIYRCEGCAASAVSTKDNPLPTQNHHQHTAAQGPILWRLVAASTYA
jgi:hypothetical protein